MASPLEQFEIHRKVALKFGALDVSITNASIWMGIVVIGITLFLLLATRRGEMVPGRLQSTAEMLYEFIANMVRDTVGLEGRPYFPFIFTLFSFILFANLAGMLPGAFTVTSHLAVTFALAGFIFLATVFIGIFRHGFHFLGFFIPKGVPWWVMPLIVPIEIISFLSRPITLSVRLFANMTAGHILMKVFGGFMVSLLATGSALAVISLGVMGMAVAMTALELLVAALQAYVFTLLTCLYLSDMVHMSH